MIDLDFLGLMSKIFPFYTLIVLGYIAGRYVAVDRQSIANVLFYLIVPVVFFDFGVKLKVESSILTLPLLLFCISIVLNRSYLYFCKKIWPNDARANVVAFSAGTANTGYFGLPVALMLFDFETVAIYMLMNIGLSFYDYTLGAFTIARGKFSRSEAIKSVLKMPILYTFFLGMLLSALKINIPQNFEVLSAYFTGAYAILGMMLIGLGISTIRKFEIDWKFISILLSARFIAAPAITFGLIYLDAQFFHVFDRNTHLAALLTSIVPPAANTVVFASIHHAHPEEAASAVVVGTILALFYMPLMAAWLF
jgi:predicted permease